MVADRSRASRLLDQGAIALLQCSWAARTCGAIRRAAGDRGWRRASISTTNTTTQTAPTQHPAGPMLSCISGPAHAFRGCRSAVARQYERLPAVRLVTLRKAVARTRREALASIYSGLLYIERLAHQAERQHSYRPLRPKKTSTLKMPFVNNPPVNASILAWRRRGSVFLDSPIGRDPCCGE